MAACWPMSTLEDGTCFNAELLREGYAYAYLSYPFAFMEEFKPSRLRRASRARGCGSSLKRLRPIAPKLHGAPCAAGIFRGRG
jgi:hypothetical protein